MTDDDHGMMLKKIKRSLACHWHSLGSLAVIPQTGCGRHETWKVQVSPLPCRGGLLLYHSVEVVALRFARHVCGAAGERAPSQPRCGDRTGGPGLGPDLPARRTAPGCTAYVCSEWKNREQPSACSPNDLLSAADSDRNLAESNWYFIAHCDVGLYLQVSCAFPGIRSSELPVLPERRSCEQQQ